MAKEVPLSGWKCIRLVFLKDGIRQTMEYPIEGNNDKERQESIDGYTAWMKKIICQENADYLISNWVQKEKR